MLGGGGGAGKISSILAVAVERRFSSAHGRFIFWRMCALAWRLGFCKEGRIRKEIYDKAVEKMVLFLFLKVEPTTGTDGSKSEQDLFPWKIRSRRACEFRSRCFTGNGNEEEEAEVVRNYFLDQGRSGSLKPYEAMFGQYLFLGKHLREIKR
ncbi:MAG: hypothetical protein PV362_08940, partial [Providencia heimbachae]|nr:hypothetical protein [Providencia heimbachae]